MDLSFWEQSTFFGDIDLVVIGSGIVGLNTARAIKEKRKGWKIAVLDRGVFKRSSGTVITPIFGSIVQKGKLAACAFALERQLNKGAVS